MRRSTLRMKGAVRVAVEPGRGRRTRRSPSPAWRMRPSPRVLRRRGNSRRRGAGRASSPRAGRPRRVPRAEGGGDDAWESSGDAGRGMPPCERSAGRGGRRGRLPAAMLPPRRRRHLLRPGLVGRRMTTLAGRVESHHISGYPDVPGRTPAGSRSNFHPRGPDAHAKAVRRGAARRGRARLRPPLPLRGAGRRRRASPAWRWSPAPSRASRAPLVVERWRCGRTETASPAAASPSASW